jgi:regulator of sigma E protease
MDQITDLVSLIASNVWLYGGSFLLVLSILVIVHEWGHYAVARACGVRVEEFAVGMGPEAWGFTAKNGTRWKICWLPIGGYVKMFGDTDPAGSGKTDQVGTGEGARTMTQAERSEAFFSKSVGQRAAIVAAGPAINFIFAILLLAGLFITQGREIIPPVVAGVHVGSPGAMAGLEPGDRITHINGRAIDSFDDLRRSVMLALDTPLELGIIRAGNNITVTAIPRRLSATDRFGFTHQRGYLGLLAANNGFDLKAVVAVNGVETGGDIEKARALLLAQLDKGPFKVRVNGLTDIDEVLVNPSRGANKALTDAQAKNHNVFSPGQENPKEYKKYSLFSGVAQATYQTYRISVDSLGALGQMVMGVRSPSELGGVIRIGTLAGDMANAGLIALITFTALLSINLGLINLFPIPLLDGGHLMFYAAEALRGRPIPEVVQEYAFRFGLVVLVFLMVFSNLNDILHIIL